MIMQYVEPYQKGKRAISLQPQKPIGAGLKAHTPLRFTRLATKEKFYLAQLTDGMRARQLGKKFKRAREAEAYAQEVARRLPFWRRREAENE